MKVLSRRSLLTGAGVAAASLVLPRYARAAEYVFKFSSTQPIDHPSTVRIMEAAARVKEKSGGRMEINVFHSGQLGSDNDTLTQVRNGGIHMMVLSNLITANIAPLTSIGSMPFAFNTYDQVWAAMDGNLGKQLNAAFESVGLVAVERMFDAGFHQVISSKTPIRTVDDLKGFKMRVPVAPMPITFWKAMGASPTTISFTELYTALQTRVVDGTDNPLSNYQTSRFYEVQTYCSVTNHSWDGWFILLNARAYRRLPQDLQEIVMSSFNQAALDDRADMVKLNASSRDFLASKGLQFNDVADRASFRDHLRNAGFYKEWREKFGEQAWKNLEEHAAGLI
jgi:tripartite ATP-independent transporter DctP family solute receptor